MERRKNERLSLGELINIVGLLIVAGGLLIFAYQAVLWVRDGQLDAIYRLAGAR